MRKDKNLEDKLKKDLLYRFGLSEALATITTVSALTLFAVGSYIKSEYGSFNNFYKKVCEEVKKAENAPWRAFYP